MISVSTFLENVERNAARVNRYQSGGDGTGGGCDCIGLPIGAVRLAGEKWPWTHGSNYAARYRVDNLRMVSVADDLVLGELVFKAREPGEKGYSLPSSYDTSADRRDYYHVGVVTSVSPLEITHCTKNGEENGIFRDTKLGQWKWAGTLNIVDYADQDNGEALPIYEATVTAPSGKTVNMRANPSMKSSVMEAVPIGERVGILGEYDDTWTRIEYHGKKGYMMARYLIQGIQEEEPEEVLVPRIKLLEMRACIADCMNIIDKLV